MSNTLKLGTRLLQRETAVRFVWERFGKGIGWLGYRINRQTDNHLWLSRWDLVRQL